MATNESAGRREVPSAPREPRRRAPKKKRRRRLSPTLLIFAGVLAAVIAVAVIYPRTLEDSTPEETEQSVDVPEVTVTETETEKAETGNSSASASSQNGWLNEAKNLESYKLDNSLFSRDDNGFKTYYSAYCTGYNGIDVSSHQGNIDWDKVKADGIEFVIVRIGYRGYATGNLNPDDNYEQNLEGAQAAGLQVGAYFYSQATSVDEALDEAEYAVKLLDGFSLDLPLFYDWELDPSDDSRTNALTNYDMLTSCATAFCSTVSDEGYQPGVLFYRYLAENNYELNRLGDYSFWLAQLNDYPDFDYNITFWQYSQTGSVDGISGDVDLNLMFIEK